MQTELRLFQLISPSLPIGAFTYSQGLEWAVEAGWVSDLPTFESWLDSQLNFSIETLELPMLRLMLCAIEDADWEQLDRLSVELIAWRETKELRLEEHQRGAALLRLLPSLDIDIPEQARNALQRSQLSGMALAAAHWRIPGEKLILGYLWSWLENSVMAGVKLIPLGQTQGQQLLTRLTPRLEKSADRAAKIEVSEMGSSTPALAIASSLHERQYTRLFRS